MVSLVASETLIAWIWEDIGRYRSEDKKEGVRGLNAMFCLQHWQTYIVHSWSVPLIDCSWWRGLKPLIKCPLRNGGGHQHLGCCSMSSAHYPSFLVLSYLRGDLLGEAESWIFRTYIIWVHNICLALVFISLATYIRNFLSFHSLKLHNLLISNKDFLGFLSE